MPRVASPEASDVEMSDAEQKSKRAKREEEDASDTEGQGDGAEEEEGEEEEYEIEQILEAKRGMFERGRIGYYVKWKNYSTEHNSWVDEQDAGNATELIKQFWEKKKAAGRPRKSIGSASKATIASERNKSAEQSDDASISVAKKRRKSKGGDVDAEDEPRSAKKSKASEAPAKKRATKAGAKETNGSISAQAAPQTDDDEQEEITVGNMDKHLNIPDWTHLVQSVDTVSKSETDGLFVYFTLTSGERVRADAAVCKERFPQKLLDFYEAHLRWKTAEEAAGE